MQVPLSWLKTYLEAPLELSEVVDRLTLSGIEVEHTQPVGASDPRVVAAEIRSLDALAQGLFRVTVAADRERTVVSGAQGLSVGDRVALALPGAFLFSESGGLREVTAQTLRGVESEGALVHALDLGIGADTETPLRVRKSADNGAPALSFLETAPGSAQGGDVVLHLSILPNIARCQSMRGVAREVAAVLGRPLPGFETPAAFSAPERLSPTIEARAECSRLGVTLIEKVRVTDSLEWLRRRLCLAGMTPVNNVVDASNYVMLELGQPTHPYDADRLKSLDLGVRLARSGERLLTLQQPDGEEPAPIPEGVPLIVSGDEPVSLAGVLGGRPTAIAEATTRVLLESASFDLGAIRRSQKATKTFSEASARFSRGVDPELCAQAERRFLEVLRETSQELEVRAYGEIALERPPVRRITLSLAELNGALGTAFSLRETADSLERAGLELEVNEAKESLTVTAGSARADLTLPCDVIEEVARLRGYDNVPETLPEEPIPEQRHPDTIGPRERLRDLLVRFGLQEVLSYSLSSLELEALLLAGHPDASPARSVPVMNPVSADRSVLRSSLLPALLQAASANLKHGSSFRLFEIGPVFTEGAPDGLPSERQRAAIVLSGAAAPGTLHDSKPRPVDFFDLRAALDPLVFALSGARAQIEPFDAPPFRPGACARLVQDGRVLGVLGAVHPLVLRGFDFGDHPAVGAELDLEALLVGVGERRAFVEYDRLPSIELDIAMFVKKNVLSGTVRQIARETAGPMLREVEVFDEFLDEKLGEDRKSLAIRLRLNAGERTLQMEEALAVRARVAEALRARLPAEIRE